MRRELFLSAWMVRTWEMMSSRKNELSKNNGFLGTCKEIGYACPAAAELPSVSLCDY